MCIRAIEWALACKVGNLHAKLVLICLADNADAEHFQCWPSANHIAARTELSKSTVHRAIFYLIEHEFVYRERRHQDDGGWRSSLYTLLVRSREGLVSNRDKVVPIGDKLVSNGQGASPQLGRNPCVSVDAEKRHLNRHLKQVPAADAAGGLFDLDQGTTEEAEPADESPRARLFRKGKTMLVALGVAEKRTGSLIGSWLKKNPDEVGLLALITYAYDAVPAEPVSYITALLKTGGKTNGRGQGRKTFEQLGRELLDDARRRDRGETDSD